MATSTTLISCKGCEKQFTSKNQLFRHLNQSAKTCLSPEEYEDFLKNVISARREKIGVLFGYLPGTDYRLSPDSLCDVPCGIEGGDHAAWLVTQAIDRVSRGVNGKTSVSGTSWSADAAADSKINRSYGATSRQSESVAQDPNTGAVTEVLCTNALPLDFESIEEKDECEDAAKAKRTESKKQMNAWVDTVNEELERILAEMASSRSTSSSTPNETREWSPGRVRVFGRVTILQKKFNAETDVTRRRLEYCFPADLMFASEREDLSKTAVQPETSSLQEYCDSLPSFPPGNRPYPSDCHNPRHEQKLLGNRPNEKTLAYLYQMKKVMKRVTTQVEEIEDNDAGAVLEKEFHDAKRKKKKQRKGPKDKESSTKGKKDEISRPLSSKRVLKRKRFHNFCPSILAHDFLAYRRVDRVFHRGTIRLEGPPSSDGTMIKDRPFVVFSLTGDLFLQEQAVRVIGLLIAVFRGLIDDDIIEMMFDEEYTNLVPAPPAPSLGLLSGEVSYMAWEGRMKAILTARRTDRYDEGWNDESVVSAVEEWEKNVLNDVATGWYCEGVAEDGRLNTETQWLENVLYPWAKRTRVLLEDYRRWKASTLLPSIESINPAVPPLFERVLYHLRQADASGLWPTTTPNRQLVMLSTTNEGSQTLSLSSAHSNAKKNSDTRSSAYSFKEGEGGASGSFSVGAMPGEQCSQPKGNSLFPELVKAAFELETMLCPDREPSSTIAINRNAQFRPHTDNGAGAGQSKSLIVGFGNYVGGELMVEGEKKDIRYKAIEFDGWKERHWTLPFQGERFSLVWFTPKGCEGVRGIDLNLPSSESK
ncbi:hypothetical protein ACHAXR_009138 [Thalassiosira sp. AJA248-18]